MKFIKGIISSLLVFLVVIALSLLGLIVTLNMTVLNPDFVVKEMDTLDIYSVVFDEIKEHVPEEVPEQALDDLFIEYKPWIIEQIHTIVYSGYSYVKGGEEFSVTISLEYIKAGLEQNIIDYIRDYLPPALLDAPESLIEPYISEIYDEIAKYIPDEIELDEATVGSEVVAGLEQVRQIIDYIRIAYIIAVFVIVFSVLILALLYSWRFKPVARYTGIAFIAAGLISLINALLARATNIGVNLLSGENFIPSGFNEIAVQIITDSTRPLLYFGIGIVVAGVSLLLVSIFTRQAEEVI